MPDRASNGYARNKSPSLEGQTRVRCAVGSTLRSPIPLGQQALVVPGRAGTHCWQALPGNCPHPKASTWPKVAPPPGI